MCRVVAMPLPCQLWRVRRSTLPRLEFSDKKVFQRAGRGVDADYAYHAWVGLIAGERSSFSTYVRFYSPVVSFEHIGTLVPSIHQSYSCSLSCYVTASWLLRLYS